MSNTVKTQLVNKLAGDIIPEICYKDIPLQERYDLLFDFLDALHLELYYATYYNGYSENKRIFIGNKDIDRLLSKDISKDLHIPYDCDDPSEEFNVYVLRKDSITCCTLDGYIPSELMIDKRDIEYLIETKPDFRNWLLAIITKSLSLEKDNILGI